MNRKLLLLAAIAIATPLAPAAAWFHAGGWSGGGSLIVVGAQLARRHRFGRRRLVERHRRPRRHGQRRRRFVECAPAIAAARRAAVAASWSATGINGNHYYGGPDYNHGGYYGAYNAPTVVNAYGTNCYNCGGWNTGGAVAAGMLAGAAVGAAAASSANNQAAYAPAFGRRGLGHRRGQPAGHALWHAAGRLHLQADRQPSLLQLHRRAVVHARLRRQRRLLSRRDCTLASRVAPPRVERPAPRRRAPTW